MGQASRHEWIIDILGFIIALLIFSLILLNISPTLIRMLASKVRTGFTGFLPIFFVLLYIAFRLPGPLGRFFSVILTFSFFAMALMGLWITGQSQSTVFNGIVPLYDASGYYIDALRLLSRQDFVFFPFSGRRPLFPGFLALLLALANRNLMIALGVLTALTAAACYLAAKEIQRTHGAEAAIFVLTILFLFYRYNSGPVMSESLGIPLGVLGFALLWRGTAEARSSPAMFGLWISTLALNARAGAFFILPLLLLWGSWRFREEARGFSKKFLIQGLTAISAGFLVNWLVLRALAVPSAGFFVNFSYSLYGLASGGKNWMYVFTSHPELLKLQEPYQSETIYKMAFEQIIQDPRLTLQGALVNWQTFFSNSRYGAYSYIARENTNENPVVYWGLYILCFLGIYRWSRKPSDPFSSLIIVTVLGVVLSVPFLPPADASRLRPYAATIMVFALLPMLGIAWMMEQFNTGTHLLSKPDPSFPHQASVLWFSLALALAATIGPLIVKLMGRPLELPPTSCNLGTSSIVTRFDSGTYFNVNPDEDASFQDGMPNFHLSTVKRNSHGLPDTNLTIWAIRLKPPVTIFDALDYRTNGNALVVSQSKLLPEPGALLEICGDWETDPDLSGYNIFYAQSINVLRP